MRRVETRAPEDCHAISQWSQGIRHSALRDYVADKFTRIVRHYDQLHDDRHLEPRKLFMAEARRCAANKYSRRCACRRHTYAAIDALADKLDRQVEA